MAPKYSICITNYNTVDTIRESLESLLNQIDDSFEIIVCDNSSTDGSREILKKYADQGKLKLVSQKDRNRGKGRQCAYEHSSGDLILACFDMDDVFKPTLREILRKYHADHEGYMLILGGPAFIPRYLVEQVGGWRTWPTFEDIDFANRVASLGKVHYFPDASPLAMRVGTRTRGVFRGLREVYIRKQTAYALSLSYPTIGIRPHPSWYARRIIWFVESLALLSCRLRRIKRLDDRTNEIESSPHAKPDAGHSGGP